MAYDTVRITTQLQERNSLREVDTIIARWPCIAIPLIHQKTMDKWLVKSGSYIKPGRHGSFIIKDGIVVMPTKMNQATWRRWMALSITDDCINCGLCVPVCPTGAISEGDYIFVIDPDKCNECVGYFDQPQCVVVGPVDCFLDANGNPYRLPRP